jgi:ribosomal protein S18 acetylase RimI-like enzyme
VSSSGKSDDRFIADFTAQCAGFGLRTQCSDDADFLTALFIMCSPLVASLPAAMAEQQARFQNLGHVASHPNASRYIVLSGICPVGRIVIDWNTDGLSHCVDIALNPGTQGKGVGTKLLLAWVRECRLLKRGASLQVLSDNPAIALYKRLGFVGTEVSDQPAVTMRLRV